MKSLPDLFERNQKWAIGVLSQDPDFFTKLSRQQTPEYLWIGCSDSRVPANQIVGLLPGELFVHRNVGNLVVHTDFNCLAVIQFAVAVLKVRHIILCGHYGCGGVAAAMGATNLGIIDNWLRHIKDVSTKHESNLSLIPAEKDKLNRLAELNVAEQVKHICGTTIVREAWEKGQHLAVHGWIYGIENGLLHDLGVTVERFDSLEETYQLAIKRLYRT